MKIKELTKNDRTFQFIADKLDFMSSAGRRYMQNTDFCNDGSILEREWSNIERIDKAISLPNNKRPYNDLRHSLMQLHDIMGTLVALANHVSLNEVDLFELKNLARITQFAATAADSLKIPDILSLPNLDEVFHLLDPDNTSIVNFYIYDSYDERLAPLRRELKTLQEHGGDPSKIQSLLSQQNDIQLEVCTRLSDSLLPYHTILSEALEKMSYADFLLARVELARKWDLVRPTISNHIRYQALVNPRLKLHNEDSGLRYQPIDIIVENGVTLITGANMAGKTVLLKSLSTAQLMAQCGMFVPATKAEIMLFDAVVTSIGDEQDEMNGLSSYASEIIKISNIVKRSRNEKLLALIDEPARTTNPIEGKALVQSIITIMESKQSATIITTHYSQLGTRCHRLRVKGFVEDMANVPLTPQNINHFIDYSLTDDDSDNVPQEALRIASILGCDEDMIAEAIKHLSTD